MWFMGALIKERYTKHKPTSIYFFVYNQKVIEIDYW